MQDNHGRVVVREARVKIPANGSETLHVYADFVHCTAASAEFTVKTRRNDRAPLNAGVSLRFGDFVEELTLTNDTGADNEIVILYGSGEYRNQRVAGAVSITDDTPPDDYSAPADITISATGVAEIALAADLQRRSFTVQAASGNAGTVRVTDGAAGTGGPILQPGQAWSDEHTAAVYIIGTAGDVVSLAETGRA